MSSNSRRSLQGQANQTHDNGAHLATLEAEIEACRACPRLVSWREEVAASPRASYAGDVYWGRPLAGFGDPQATVFIVGLAPAAHGGNRTGRVFTGDRSGDFLFSALHRAGYANRSESAWRDDGLKLSGAYISAAVRCAPPQNKPTPNERDRCAHFLVEELTLLPTVRVVVALGAFALDALWRLETISGPKQVRARRPKFAHGLEIPIGSWPIGGATLLCSYHPSQRNVFTGLLKPEAFDALLGRARTIAGELNRPSTGSAAVHRRPIRASGDG